MSADGSSDVLDPCSPTAPGSRSLVHARRVDGPRRHQVRIDDDLSGRAESILARRSAVERAEVRREPIEGLRIDRRARGVALARDPLDGLGRLSPRDFGREVFRQGLREGIERLAWPRLQADQLGEGRQRLLMCRALAPAGYA